MTPPDKMTQIGDTLTLRVLEIFGWGSALALLWCLALTIVRFEAMHVGILLIFCFIGLVGTASLDKIRRQ